MSQLFLSVLIAAVITICLSRFVVPACFRSLPIPVEIYPRVNIAVIIAIFVCSFLLFYYLLAWNHKDVIPSENPNGATQTHPDTASSQGGRREAARVLVLEALRQGTALSVAISNLPKLERVHQAARDLLEISPRYQEQETAAKKSLSEAAIRRDRSLRDYLSKVVELSRYKPEHVSGALDSIRNGDLTHREKAVADLLTNHVSSVRESGKADSVHWLSEFTQRFTNFVD